MEAQRIAWESLCETNGVGGTRVREELGEVIQEFPKGSPDSGSHQVSWK